MPSMSFLSNLDPDPPSHRRRRQLSPLDPGVQRRPSMQEAHAYPSPFRASCRHLFPSSAAMTGQEDVGLTEIRRREPNVNPWYDSFPRLQPAALSKMYQIHGDGLGSSVISTPACACWVAAGDLPSHGVSACCLCCCDRTQMVLQEQAVLHLRLQRQSDLSLTKGAIQWKLEPRSLRSCP